MSLVDRERLLGAWTLVHWRLIAADGTVSHPFTDAARGRVIYEPGGYMSVFLVRPEASSTGSGFIAYGGQFDVLEGEVHHKIDMASDPSLVGTLQERSLVVSEVELALGAPAIADPSARHVLTWRRLQA